VSKALGLECGDTRARRGKLIVASTLVVAIWRGPSARRSDQAVVNETLDDAIQIARLELHQAVGRIGDGSGQGIAMLLVFDEREQQQEINRSKREKAAKVGRHGLGGPI
jgi:hypothetical protein